MKILYKNCKSIVPVSTSELKILTINKVWMSGCSNIDLGWIYSCINQNHAESAHSISKEMWSSINHINGLLSEQTSNKAAVTICVTPKHCVLFTVCGDCQDNTASNFHGPVLAMMLNRDFLSFKSKAQFSNLIAEVL